VRHEALVKQQTMDDLQQQINQSQRRVSQLQEQREEIRDQLEQALRRTAVINERQVAIREQLVDIEQELPLLEKQKVNTQELLQEAVDDLQLAQQQLHDQRSSLALFQQSFQTQQVEIDQWQTKSVSIEKNFKLLQTQLAQNEGKLSQLHERQKDSEAQQSNQESQQLAKLVAEGERQTALLNRAGEEIEEIRRQRRDLQQNRTSLIITIKKSRKHENKERLRLNELRERTARLETKTQLLNQLRQKEVEFDRSVALIGSLAELLTIPDKYRIAIESALLERLATFIVADTDSLWQLINHSHQANFTAASLSDIQIQDLRSLPDDDGVIQWAINLVTYEKEITNVASSLLGPVLVVNSRDNAYDLVASLPAGTMAVSLDGFVVYAGGVVRAYNADEQNSLLVRESVWREAKENLQKSRIELESRESELLTLQNKIQDLQEQIDQLQNEDRKLGRQENESVQKLSLIQRRVDHNEQQQSFISRQAKNRENESRQLNSRIRELENQIVKDKEKVRLLEVERDHVQLKLKNLPLAEGRQQQETLRQGIESAKTIVAGRLAVVDSRRTTLGQIDQQLSRYKQRRESLREQQEKLELEKSNIHDKSLQEQQMNIDQQINPIHDLISQIRDDLFTLQKKLAKLQRHAHEVETVYTQTQVRFTQQESQIEGLQERIHNDLGLVALRYDKDQSGPVPLPISDVFDQLPSVDRLPTDIEKTIQQYRGQLQRMGNINPDAPAEYQETQERFEFMTQQVEDLQATEEQLRNVISELDDLTSRAFAATVEEVNGVFGETFTQLFGGGTARLVLTDPDDLTVSGVDIIARLPNRREQGLGLLSGGERSLTASALIFSLLKVSPTPFCVLDEVDAALDEANINRFRELLRELSLKTQIIVITHNRGTVQAAQTIYGVSMQPDSASQVISIRPEEYVRQELI
ncbi:MAG: hypothetical protein R3293_06140, partial [Candidatus Promineifilaceae bacterium]|nr:hypothetical protein [Candidatus Promineifilaceae bacterium]